MRTFRAFRSIVTQAHAVGADGSDPGSGEKSLGQQAEDHGIREAEITGAVTLTNSPLWDSSMAKAEWPCFVPISSRSFSICRPKAAASSIRISVS
jgi:hypothetical protein